MRRYLRYLTTFMLVLTLGLLLTACGGGNEEPTATPEPPAAVEEPTAEEAEAEEPAEPEESTEESAGDEGDSEAAESETDETVESSEEISATEEMTVTEEMTATEDAAASEVMTDTEEMDTEETDTEEADTSEEVSASDEMTATEEVAPSETVTETETGADDTEAESSEVAEEDSGEATDESTSGEVSVLTERLVSEIVDERFPYFAAVAPDGSAIVYAVSSGRGRNLERSLCLYVFENASKDCYDVPEEFLGYPYELVWSPDSAYIATTEDLQTLGNESDIWLFDVAAGTFTNYTDDGVQGSYLTDEPADYLLDYLPMWNEADGQLYFWRSERLDFAEFTLDLYRLDPAGGEPEHVSELTPYLSGQLMLYNNEAFFLKGVSALSPDGSQVAILMRSPFGTANAAGDGLWLMSLADPEAEPQQVVTMEQFQSALPIFQNMPATPVGLDWTGNSAGVVVAASSKDSHAPLLLLYYVDAAAGTMTPVVDFSAVPDLETLYSEQDEQGLPLRYYSPWTATLSPAGDKLLMYNDLGGVPGMLVASLPPDGSAPTPVYEGQESLTTQVARSSTSADGKVLMYSLMLTIEE